LKTINSLLLFVLISFTFCTSPQTTKTNSQTIPSSETEECSKYYPFQGYYINLEDNNAELIDDVISTNFKTCSKYAHRFTNPISQSVSLNGKTFVVEQDKEKETYNIGIFEGETRVHTIKLPVESPLPEVREYSIYLLPYKEDIIMYMQDMYTTHYTICKYNSEGDELMSIQIEHTFVTHPDPNTNYQHRYLYLKELTNSQMVFSSHSPFAEKAKTVVLSMDDFTTVEYDKTANGLILDEDDKELAGFVTQTDDHFKVQMVDGKNYAFEIKYGNPGCDFILKDNLLYIANYHPIATGSSLHCFDLNTGEMKWTADVKQVMADHSEYSNIVVISMYKDKIIMEGDEESGDYVQIFDAETGKRLAVFGDFLDVEE
jgi:hypothetical protein